MTRQRDLKNRVRTRMEKTGESYAAARRQVVNDADKQASAGKRIYAFQGQCLRGLITKTLQKNTMDGSRFWLDASAMMAETLINHLVATDTAPTPRALLETLGRSHAEFIEWTMTGPEGIPGSLVGPNGFFGDPKVYANVVLTLTNELHGLESETPRPERIGGSAIAASGSTNADSHPAGEIDTANVVAANCPTCGDLISAAEELNHRAACERDTDPKAPSDTRFWRTWGLRLALVMEGGDEDAAEAFFRDFCEKWGYPQEVALLRMTEEIEHFTTRRLELEASPKRI